MPVSHWHWQQFPSPGGCPGRGARGPAEASAGRQLQGMNSEYYMY